LNAVFKKQNANIEYRFDCKGVSNPQDRFLVGHSAKIMFKFGISCVGIFPIAGAFGRFGQKCIRGKAFFRELSAFPRDLQLRKLRPTEITLRPVRAEGLSYPAV
jgi:hypothetical protein